MRPQISILPLASLAALLLSSVCSTMAQNDQSSPAADPQSGASSFYQRRVPPPVQPASTSADAEESVAVEPMIPNIQFPNGDVRDVLNFYKKLTGKEIIYDNTVQGTVNIVISRPVTKEEAIQIIEATLLVNGFILVPGPSENLVTVLGTTKNPRQYGVPVLSDLSEIPESDQIVTFLFKLQYADPTEVQQALSQYIPPSQSTVIIPLPRSQSLLITDSTSSIRSLARIIAAFDQPPAEVVSEFFQLHRADAKEVVEKLTQIFDKAAAPSTGTNAPIVAPNFGGPGGGGPPGGPNSPAAMAARFGAAGGSGLSEDTIIVGKIKLTADVRTNRIHVVTRPINLPFIQRLIAEYDSNISYGEPTKWPLRFVSALDVIDIIANVIVEPGENKQGQNNQQTGQQQNNRQNNQNRNTQSGGGGGGSGSVNFAAEELSALNEDVSPEIRTIGNTRIIADTRSNSIIVMGNEEVKQKIFDVLQEIDVRVPQVMLTAIIGELSLDEGQEFGVDYIQTLGNRVATSGTDGTTILPARSGYAAISRGNTGINIKDLADLTTISGLATGAAGGYTGFIGITKDIEVIVRALESSGRFRITSRPMVFASNNKKALIASGQSIAVPSSITSGFTGGSDNLVSTATVAYKDVLLQLEVVPLINSDREVTLDIIQNVNSISGSTEISGNFYPNISARKIKTSVSVANESTIVLGGLVQDSKDVKNTGIPILSKLPVVGPLFGSRKKTNSRTELVILLKPIVTYGPNEAVDTGERVRAKLDFPPDLDSTLDPAGTKIDSTKKKRTFKSDPPASPPKPRLRAF